MALEREVIVLPAQGDMVSHRQTVPLLWPGHATTRQSSEADRNGAGWKPRATAREFLNRSSKQGCDPESPRTPEQAKPVTRMATTLGTPAPTKPPPKLQISANNS